jgi:hypothetical protein
LRNHLVIFLQRERQEVIKELDTLDNNRREDKHKGRYTFVTKTKKGLCPLCDENVYDNQLFVEENAQVFHYSCHAEKKMNEK